MYDWRNMTDVQRAEALELRKSCQQAWHRPSETVEGKWVHVSAACFEHRYLIGHHPDRISRFCDELLLCIQASCLEISAWCVLPNHYHALVRIADISYFKKKLGQLHGRTSHQWNVEEGMQGRKCFHSCLPKQIKSLSHRWATLNYIHHNPVKHGYVKRWQDWPFTSAHAYLENVGKTYAKRMWVEFPILNIGKGWDDE
jgi:putative transposase